jgi:hypothetical protein
LRVGMTENDVESVLGKPVPLTFEWVMDHPSPHPRAYDWTDWVRHSAPPIGFRRLYEIGPNWLGTTNVLVSYGADKRVKTWEVYRLPRTRPSWLDAALKWVGW